VLRNSPVAGVKLTTLAAVLVAVAGFEICAYCSDAIAPPRSPAPSIVETPHGSSLPDVGGSVATILARPLFEMERRPLTEAALANTTPAVGRLTGIIIVSQNEKFLIFAGAEGAKPIVLTEGGRIGADIVQTIAVGQATLLGPDGLKTIRPSFEDTGTSTEPEAVVKPTAAARGSRVSKHLFASP